MRKRSGKIFIQNNDYVKDIRVPGTYKKSGNYSCGRCTQENC